MILWIYIEPRRLGGYNSYFESISKKIKGYPVIIEAYGVWPGKIMSLSNFRQILSAYHPGFRESAVGGKCHQLRFLIGCINSDFARTFYLDPNASSDEWVIANRSQFCCVHKYNKYNPENSELISLYWTT